MLLTSLSASRESTFLKARQEDINILIEYEVTDADLRMAGIARRIGDLTSNEVQELIRVFCVFRVQILDSLRLFVS